jgi:hypothetical protein
MFVIDSVRICMNKVGEFHRLQNKLKIITFHASKHCSFVLIRCNETVVVSVIVTKTTLGIGKNIPARPGTTIITVL